MLRSTQLTQCLYDLQSGCRPMLGRSPSPARPFSDCLQHHFHEFLWPIGATKGSVAPCLCYVLRISGACVNDEWSAISTIPQRIEECVACTGVRGAAHIGNDCVKRAMLGLGQRILSRCTQDKSNTKGL